jgi:hypothetical protein
MRLIYGGRGNRGRAIGKVNVGELFWSVLMGKVVDVYVGGRRVCRWSTPDRSISKINQV